MSKGYRKYSPEFREEVVKLVIDTSRAITDVAREYGVHDTTLGNWVREYKEKNGYAAEEPLTLNQRARLRELEAQNRELAMKCAFLDKSSGVLCSGASVRDKYEFIDAEYAAAAADTATTAPTISQMCEWLRVSKSGILRMAGQPRLGNIKRREEIKLYITKAFEDSDGTLPATGAHARPAAAVGRRVRRRARPRPDARAGPRPLSGAAPTVTHRPGRRRPDPGPRQATTSPRKCPAERSSANITYIFTWEGWLYLATVIDCATRMVVGWAIDDQLQDAAHRERDQNGGSEHQGCRKERYSTATAALITRRRSSPPSSSLSGSGSPSAGHRDML